MPWVNSREKQTSALNFAIVKISKLEHSEYQLPYLSTAIKWTSWNSLGLSVENPECGATVGHCFSSILTIQGKSMAMPCQAVGLQGYKIAIITVYALGRQM